MNGEPTKEPTRHIDDPDWLARVRSDLDSKAEDWVVPVHKGAITKMEALGSYLDTILTELGHKGRLHECSECHVRHLGPVR